jgi:uncharacterized repeat protein (TIGR03803 family)
VYPFMKTNHLRRIAGLPPGLMVLLSLTVGPVAAQTNFTILKHFNGVPDAAVPFGALVVDGNNVFYGTTIGGGVSNAGAVFKLNADGSGYGVLKSLVASNGTGPQAGLVLGADGMLYGTAYSGGASNFGTVFALNRDGSGFGVLHSFTGTTDGANPEGPVIEGSDGVLYGTTYFANSATRGTVFKINKNGTGYSIIHTFLGSVWGDGQQPECRLLEGSDGALYGTTGFGGAHNAGTVFTINKDGSGYNILYSFRSFIGDGLGPTAGLMEGSDQALYGTTYKGGAISTNQGGTAFKINKDGGGYQILHDFSLSTADASRPNGELVEGSDGALYGGCDYGGHGSGAFFKMNKDGSGYSILRTLFGPGGGDGYLPKCALVQLSNDVFYGTTELGGGGAPTAAGCVFALSSAPLPPRGLSVSVSPSSNTVHFAATSSVQYDVERSTNFSSWSALTTLTSPTNGQINYVDLNPPGLAGFYRLKLH